MALIELKQGIPSDYKDDGTEIKKPDAVHCINSYNVERVVVYETKTGDNKSLVYLASGHQLICKESVEELKKLVK